MQDKSLEYLDFIRTKPCCVCGERADPHHLKCVGMGRNRQKPMPEHFTAIPLCPDHHTLDGDSIHRLRNDRFYKAHGVKPWKVATLLLAEWLWNE